MQSLGGNTHSEKGRQNARSINTHIFTSPGNSIDTGPRHGDFILLKLWKKCLFNNLVCFTSCTLNEHLKIPQSVTGICIIHKYHFNQYMWMDKNYRAVNLNYVLLFSCVFFPACLKLSIINYLVYPLNSAGAKISCVIIRLQPISKPITYQFNNDLASGVIGLYFGSTGAANGCLIDSLTDILNPKVALQSN